MPVDPQMQAVLDQFGKFKAPPLESLSPENARNAPTLKNAVEEMIGESVVARTLNVAKPTMPQPVGQIHHLLIPSPNGDILARVYQPAGEGPFPILVYFHGGGWVIANLDVYEPTCRALCKALPCIVISVAYRQAPEHPFPAAVEDAFHATQWVISNAQSLGGQPHRVAVAGESAGGNLATVVCLKSRDEARPLPVAQLLIYPVTDSRMDTASYREHAKAVPLNAAMMPWFWNHYLKDHGSANEPYASPMHASDLRGLPRAIILTAEIDPLRDEGEAYAQRLVQAGVPVKAKRYDGVTHEFFGLGGVVSKAQEALRDAVEGLNLAFGDA